VSWPDGTVAASFGFLHALYCQGILERVPHARRIEWQRRIGLRQEQAYGDQGAAIAAELAMRFEAARDLERSVRYLQLAGVGALTRCAYPESIALLRRALELVPKLPASQRSRLELDVLLPLGVALMAVKGYAHDDVEHTYARARSLCLLCARPGDLERVLRGQWNVAFVRADLAAAQAIADQLLSHAESEGDETLALDAHTKLGQGFLHLGELAAARRHLERALELCADGQAAGLRAAPRVAIYLSWALWHAGLGTQARQRADEALVLSRDAGSPHSSAFALGYGMILYVLCGELTRALEHRDSTRSPARRASSTGARSPTSLPA
jgi:adenylate cyclase